MKRKLALLVAVIMIAMVILPACGKQEGTKTLAVNVGDLSS